MNEIPPAVRILPMDSIREFSGRKIEEVQHQFFLGELLRQDRPPGKYWYHASGLQAPRGTAVLFQYSNFLVADARFQRTERFPEPEDDYNGALYFDPKTIRVFDPVPSDIVNRIWPEFKGFSHVKWTLDPKRYPDFERQLKHVETAKA